MQASIVIESGDNRYEVFFDIEDPDAASDRLGTVLGDLEKRFVKRRTREPAVQKTRPAPAITGPATPGGAK